MDPNRTRSARRSCLTCHDLEERCAITEQFNILTITATSNWQLNLSQRDHPEMEHAQHCERSSYETESTCVTKKLKTRKQTYGTSALKIPIFAMATSRRFKWSAARCVLSLSIIIPDQQSACGLCLQLCSVENVCMRFCYWLQLHRSGVLWTTSAL